MFITCIWIDSYIYDCIIVYNCAYPKTSDNAGVAQATQLPIRNLVARKGSAFFPPLKTE